ncbi:hypothetical protein D3C77_37710 [compost metagenome]
MVEHVNIPDGQRHEPKGAGTALLNQVAHSNGNGTTTFKFVDYANIVNKPGVFAPNTVLSAFSSAAQTPVALDTPLQINFGSPQSNADITLAANGTLTFNTSGTFAITLFLRFGRTAGGGSAILLTRFLINDVQGLNTNGVLLPDATSVTPFSTSLLFTVTGGTTFKLQLVRDSAGINNGGLTSLIPTIPGWNVVPSATIVVTKLTG